MFVKLLPYFVSCDPMHVSEAHSLRTHPIEELTDQRRECESCLSCSSGGWSTRRELPGRTGGCRNLGGTLT